MDRIYQWICDNCGDINPCPSSGTCRHCKIGEIHKMDIPWKEYNRLSDYYFDRYKSSKSEDDISIYDRFNQFIKEKYAVPHGYKMKEFDIVDENLDWSMFEKPVEEQLVPFERKPFDHKVANGVATASNSSMKCPYCKSTNVSKVSNLGKVAKVGLFGLLGTGDLGKTWKCGNCGSKW